MADLPINFAALAKPWSPQHRRLFEAVIANDVATAQDALRAGADPFVELRGPDDEKDEVVTPAAQVFRGTLPDPDFSFMRQVNLEMLDLLLDHAPPEWILEDLGRNAMKDMFECGVTNRLDALDVMLRHGYIPRSSDILDTTFDLPLATLGEEPERAYAKLDPLPLWDKLWENMPEEMQDRLNAYGPFDTTFYVTMEPHSLQQARWLISHGATLGPVPEEWLRPRMDVDHANNQRCLEHLIRHEAVVIEQRFGQIFGLLAHRAELREIGFELDEASEKTLLAAIRHIDQVWPGLSSDSQSAVREAAPLQWFVNQPLGAEDRSQAQWLIAHGASLLTAFPRVDAQGRSVPTHALEQMVDDDARAALMAWEDELGMTLLRPVEPVPPSAALPPSLSAALARLSQGAAALNPPEGLSPPVPGRRPRPSP